MPFSTDAINNAKAVDFLVGLLNTPSPTGYTPEGIAYVRAAFEALNIPNFTIDTTNKGSLRLHWKGATAEKPRGVTAHVDTLGAMVKEVKANGRLKLAQLGGWMWPAVEFETVTIRTQDDRRYRGTILPVNASTHVSKDVATLIRNESNMEVRLDAKVFSAADTRALGIEVGDFVFLDPHVEVIDTGFIRSRHLDDKICVANIYSAIDAMHASGEIPAHDTLFIISNYEEVGHGGAAGWPENLDELLAIDMAAMGEGQTSDEYSVTICVKDSSGPYHLLMNQKLHALVKAHDIPHKTDIYPFYSSDGSAYWRAGGDARVGLIGPGVDASHAYERSHEEGLFHTTHLLVRYLLEP